MKHPLLKQAYDVCIAIEECPAGEKETIASTKASALLNAIDKIVTGLEPVPMREVDPTTENNFTYHAPKPGQGEKYQALREKAKELAYLIIELCPKSREASVALTHLETATFWANASIARHE